MFVTHRAPKELRGSSALSDMANHITGNDLLASGFWRNAARRPGLGLTRAPAGREHEQRRSKGLEHLTFSLRTLQITGGGTPYRAFVWFDNLSLS